MKSFIKSTLTVMILLISSLSSFSLPSNWVYQNTGQNHTILIQSTTVIAINGVVIEPGDYLGVFYLDGSIYKCGGYTNWTGFTSAIAAWGDDTTTPVKDGFAIGEAFNWRLWDSSTNTEYDFVVTYSTGFPSQGTYTLNGLSGLATAMSSSSIIPTITIPTCFGMSNGAINVAISTGIPPFTFQWSTGATTQNLSNLVAGNYGITVMDATLATDSLIISVTQPDSLQSNILINEENAFMCQAQAEVFPTGGTAPFTFLWNTTPPLTVPFAELCPGMHSVTITDAHNCQAIEDVLIDTLSLNVTDSAFTYLDTCLISFLPDTAYISNLYFSSGSLLIEWTFVFPTSSFILQTFYPGIVTPGVFYVGLVINCPSKSYLSLSFVDYIVIPELLELSSNTDWPSCPDNCDGSITLNVSSGNPPFSYFWSNGATSQNLTGLCSGVYSLTVVDSTGFTYVESFTLPQAVGMNIVQSVQNSTCHGTANGSIGISVSGGASPFLFNWSNGQSVNEITGISAGMYELTITDSLGCSIVATYEVLEPEQIVLNENITDASAPGACDGMIATSVQGGVAPYSYLWSTGENNTGLENLCAGIYSLTLTDNNTCQMQQDFEIQEIISIDSPQGIEPFCDIFPNPAYHNINLCFNQMMSELIKLEVYNAIGSLTLEQNLVVKMPGIVELQLPEMSSGICFIKAYFSNGTNQVIRFCKAEIE